MYLYIYIKNLHTYLTLYTEIDSNCILDIKVNSKAKEIFWRSQCRQFYDIGIAKVFLNKRKKSMNHKETGGYTGLY